MRQKDENKSTEQSNVLKAWAEKGFIGTYVGFTGVGKTRIGTIAASEFIRRDASETSFVIVPTENLRDNEWEQSFIHWGYQRERPKVTIECIQSAYKRTGEYYDTLVVDEWHTTLGPQYRKFIENNKFKRILCLTATIDDDADKLEFTNKFAPIMFTTDRARAIDLKLVSESMVFNLAVSLTDDEKVLYNNANTQFKAFERELGGNMSAFDTSSRYLRLKSADKNQNNMRIYSPEGRFIYSNQIDEITIPSNLCRNLNDSEWKLLQLRIHQSQLYWKYMRERRSICCSAFNKIGIAKAIVDRYPDRRAMLFSESTIFADLIADAIGDSCVTFHSKLSKERKQKSLAEFISGEKRRISSVRALNAGTDVPECSLGVNTSTDSKKLGQVQKNGRTSRYIEGKVSYFVNLYAKDTQELSWIRKSTINSEPKWIENINELPIN